MAPKLKGSFDRPVDIKGRTVLAEVLRAALLGISAQWVISRSLDGLCLLLCPDSVWDARISDRLEQLSTSSPNHQALKRIMHADAFDVTSSAAGRLLIPAKLLQAAGIGRRCTQNGVGQVVEIWDSQRWSEYQRKSEERRDRLTEGIDQFGL